MNTTQRLLASSKEIWKKFNEHPFVLGIQNGTLDINKFRYYMIQDYLYLLDYAKVFALGVAKGKSIETANRFAKYISVMNGELDIHSGYLAKLKITQDEINSTARSLNSLSYTSYMLRIAYEEGEAEILTATLACAYSYEFISKTIVKNNPSSTDDGFYSEWIKGYISEEYSNGNIAIMEDINRLTASYTENQLNHLSDIFITCSRYELAFWEMSWTMQY